MASILFVNSDQPEIDRGWLPKDAMDTLSARGHACLSSDIQSIDDLRRLLEQYPDPIVWPVCYTIGEAVDGPLLTQVLDQLSVRYVSAGPGVVNLSSKLLFKEALSRKARHRSPDYCLADDSLDVFMQRFGFPLVVKSEFSCNSEGVRVVDGPSQLLGAIEELTKRYRQRVFVERWERFREFTVAYVPATDDLPYEAAALEFRLREGRRYIDASAKNDNGLIKFSAPEVPLREAILRLAHEIASDLKIDAYFRMDVLLNEQGALFPIEINFLPFLTRYPPSQSYFPMAFELAGTSYDYLIERLLSPSLDATDPRQRDGQR